MDATVPISQLENWRSRVLIPQGLRADGHQPLAGWDGVADIIASGLRPSVTVTVRSSARRYAVRNTMKFHFRASPKSRVPSRHQSWIIVSTMESFRECDKRMHSTQVYFTIARGSAKASLCAIGNPSHSTASFYWLVAETPVTHRKKHRVAMPCFFFQIGPGPPGVVAALMLLSKSCHLRSLSSIRSYSPN